MKRDTFCAKGLRVERQFDKYNGPLFVAWKPYASMCFRTRKELLKFCSWPAKTPTGDRLREWLNSFDANETQVDDPPSQLALTEEQLNTGFGPECFLDESDPNYQSRIII
jgi:hypothetical protein